MNQSFSATVKQAWTDFTGSNYVTETNKRLLDHLGVGPVHRLFGAGRFTSLSEDDLAACLLAFNPEYGSIDAAREAIPNYVKKPLSTRFSLRASGEYLPDENYQIVAKQQEEGVTRYEIIGSGGFD